MRVLKLNDSLNDDDQDQFSTPKTLSNALDTVEKIKTDQDSLLVAAVEAACKLRQTSINDFFNVKSMFYLVTEIMFSDNGISIFVIVNFCLLYRLYT